MARHRLTGWRYHATTVLFLLPLVLYFLGAQWWIWLTALIAAGTATWAMMDSQPPPRDAPKPVVTFEVKRDVQFAEKTELGAIGPVSKTDPDEDWRAKYGYKRPVRWPSTWEDWLAVGMMGTVMGVGYILTIPGWDSGDWIYFSAVAIGGLLWLLKQRHDRMVEKEAEWRRESRENRDR